MYLLLEHSKIQLELSIRKRSGNPPNTLKLNNAVLSITWDQEELSRVSERYCEINKQENTIWGHWWEAVKAGELLELNSSAKKECSKVRN